MITSAVLRAYTYQLAPTSTNYCRPAQPQNTRVGCGWDMDGTGWIEAAQHGMMRSSAKILVSQLPTISYTAAHRDMATPTDNLNTDPPSQTQSGLGETDPIIQQAMEEFEGGLARVTGSRVRPEWDTAAFRERLWDVVLASIALVALSPLFLLAAILTRYKSPGPLIFRQKRLGKHGVPFDILKFRSMRIDAERYLREHGDLYRRYVANNFKLDLWEDPRISACGRFMRRSKLDELPQIWNVLRGEMTLVGPRPIIPPEIVSYGIYAKRLLSVRPGVTGYWQVTMGGEMGYPRRVVLDMFYVEHKTRTLDVLILLKTFPAICFHFWKNRKSAKAGTPKNG